MNVFSSVRISQKIMLLVAWIGLGFIAMGVAYYFQVAQENEARTRITIFGAFENLALRTKSDFSEYREGYQKLAAAASPELRAEWLAQQQKLKQALAEVGKLRIQEPMLPDAAPWNAAVMSLDKAALESLEERVPEVKLVWQTDKMQAQMEAIGVIVQQHNKPAELNALVALKRLQAEFLEANNPEKLAGLTSFTQDFSASLKLVAHPDPAQVQLATALDEYRQSLTPQQSQEQLPQPRLPQPLLDEVGKQWSLMQAAVEARSAAFNAQEEERLQLIRSAFIGLIFLVVMGTAVGIYFIYKSIVFPLAHMQSVIQRITKGNMKARVKLIANDELGDLGRAFNSLLDERIHHLQEQSLENEILNNSIISLIQAVGLIARKDLTIKVPVSADITGTISDAINLLTTETAKTLWEVKEISVLVNEVADTLQEQSALVMQVAEDERKQVIAAGRALEISAKTMSEIAANAENADKYAVAAINNTQSARDTVSRSVLGILEIRETISETEKRIKRLGDRSQEISGIVNLINTIAERTHILALNASMHAASAGEAGKGFAVVADEVQRLAENAREATAEISSMVTNIRVETSDTVNIMNKLITQVAEETRLAESAGQKMEDTVLATRQLVERVQSIAQSSAQQAELSNRVRDRATIIRSFTEKTGLQLTKQKAHTDSLKQYSEDLVARVNLFTLPGFYDGVRVTDL